MIFDGVSFFRDFNIVYYTQSKNASPGWYSLRCPFHHDHADHMGYNTQSGALSCWICGKKSPLDYIKAVLGVPGSEAMRIYSKYLARPRINADVRKRKRASASMIELPSGEFTKAERRYLEKRGIGEDRITKFDIRSGGHTTPWDYRVVFPIYANGVIVSATGRSITKSLEPKYWTLPLDKELIHHRHLFFNADSINDIAVVVEGPIDAVKGGDGFMASMGVSLTDEQICALLAIDTVLFLRDSDRAGDKYTEQAYRLASLGKTNVEVVRMTRDEKDVGALDDRSIIDLRKELGLDE